MDTERAVEFARRIGGGPLHDRVILGGLATELFKNGWLRTTESKAEHLGTLAHQLIVTAKRDDGRSRRKVYRYVRNKTVVERLFTEIAPGMASDEQDQVQVTPLRRAGDKAPMAVVELVRAPQLREKKSFKVVTRRSAGALRDAARTLRLAGISGQFQGDGPLVPGSLAEPGGSHLLGTLDAYVEPHELRGILTQLDLFPTNVDDPQEYVLGRQPVSRAEDHPSEIRAVRQPGGLAMQFSWVGVTPSAAERSMVARWCLQAAKELDSLDAERLRRMSSGARTSRPQADP